MAGWADGACQPCCQGQEGHGSLGNLEGGLGKAGKGSEGRKKRACLEWGAEVGAPVPRQVRSVGVPWVLASLAPGLGGSGTVWCSAPLPEQTEGCRKPGMGSQAAASSPVPSLVEQGSQLDCGWSIARKEGEEAAVSQQEAEKSPPASGHQLQASNPHVLPLKPATTLWYSSLPSGPAALGLGTHCSMGSCFAGSRSGSEPAWKPVGTTARSVPHI